MSDELQINNISKFYNNVPVVNNVSMRVGLGEAVALFGPNGAGKTTCFSIIAGLIKPDLGQLFLDSLDITNLPIHLRAKLGLGYLPQESSIFRGLSVSDNLKAVVELFEDDQIVVEQKIEDLLSEFSISHLRFADAIRLSGGERRRLEIARAIAANPKFLMLDEPLAGIDPIAIIDIKNLINQLKRRGIGVLITDHNVRDTLDIIDRAYVIYNGKVLVEGSSKDILNSEETRKFYLGYEFMR